MHSLSHPCGAVLNTHHGLTNAVVMPYVLEFNRHRIEEKMTALARYLDLPRPSFASVAIALEGMRLVKEWLPTAYADGTDLEARANMQVASTMGATAFQKGLGAMHSLSHPCGAVLNTHHGLTNAVVMPYVLEFNRHRIEEKMTALARYLDLPRPSFASVMSWVLGLREQIGIPHTLAELGVEERNIEQLAPMAQVDPSAGTNPVTLTTEDCAQLYRNCIAGRIDHC